jgi:hypothetical protein
VLCTLLHVVRAAVASPAVVRAVEGRGKQHSFFFFQELKEGGGGSSQAFLSSVLFTTRSF